MDVELIMTREDYDELQRKIAIADAVEAAFAKHGGQIEIFDACDFVPSDCFQNAEALCKWHMSHLARGKE